MTIPEETVLEFKDPSIKDWDDWPTYSLRKVKVFSQKTGEPASLLTAHKDHSVRVLGQLDTIDAEQSHLIRDQRYRNRVIEVKDVTTYAFAEFEDGSYGFWAAGKAGWFEIKDPAAAFQPTFDMMIEAASMFYMLADKLKRARKVQQNLSTRLLDRYMTSVFKEYLLHGKNFLRHVDIDDVREGFHLHCEFLITSMLEGQEGLDWLNSPMLQYFKQSFTKTFLEIQARIYPAMGASKTQSGVTKEEDSPIQRNPAEVKGKPNAYHESLSQPCPQTPLEPASAFDQEMDISGDETDYGVGKGGRPNVRKRKSILQPSGSKFSKKAAGRRRSFTTNNRTRINATDDTQSENESLVDHRKTKSTRANQPLANSNSAPYHEYCPRKFVKVKVVDYELPSCHPQGPGGLWTCIFDGCGYRVHDASTSTGKLNIKEHFETHAQEAQEKIDLVYKESRPYLPVDNLIRRLQSFVPPSDTFATSSRPGGLQARY